MVTSWTNTGNLVSALVFLYFSGVKGFITSPPQNTAIKVGSQTHLNCSGNNGFPGWTFGEPGISIPLVALGSSCSVVPNYASSYRGEPQGSNTCNLVILNPSLQESGVYACLDNDLASQYAVLTVLSFSGTPVVNNGSEVVEGDQLKVTCTVEYGTSISVPIAPILIWTISGINITNAETTKTNNSISSSITLVTTRDGIPSYDCTAHFLPPASTSNFASNAPSNIYIGATYPITGVYYYPGNITITGGSCVNEPEPKNLTCTADANPSAVYKWLSHANNITTNGSVLTITTDGLYECIATNCIRNQTHSDTKTNNATKCPTSSTTQVATTPSTTPSTTTSDSSAVVYVAAVISVYEIANLISMGIFLAYYNMKMDENKNGNNSNIATSNKRALNNRFPWLEKMLPCMNPSYANTGQKCLGIFLFVLITIGCGVFIFPILILLVKKPWSQKDLHESQENSTLSLRLDDISGNVSGENRFRSPPSFLPPAPPSSDGGLVNRQASNTAGPPRPPPPPNKPTPSAVQHPLRLPPPLLRPPAMNEPINRDGAMEYAFLPVAMKPNLAPVQYLDEESHYTVLRRV